MMSARKSQNPPRLSRTNAMTTIIINYLRLYTSRQDVALWTPINRNGLPDVEFPTPSSLKARNDHLVRAGKTFNDSESSIDRFAKIRRQSWCLHLVESSVKVPGKGGIPWSRLNINFFLPYNGEGDHPDLSGFGDGKRSFFWIKQGKPDPASIHLGVRGRKQQEGR